VTEPVSASPPHGVHATSVDKLPASMSASLRAAAAKGDPAAEYEIAQRYADGRGVPQNLSDAADWYDRAAKQGLAPAQFRLGGFYEKGFGVKKDLGAARRLYTAAADSGNAKAMHNLAVLYAEGIDGKPDYQNAAKWFRKAADYGLSDSQYNLGILYGRGIGMQPDLAEAYKWFALAARDGDKDSAAKRDDVGSRLDPKALSAVKLAVEAWTALDQPEAATQAAAPAGGWDNFPAPPPTNTKPRNSAPRPDRATPTAAR
jgi:localization factor PodJL